MLINKSRLEQMEAHMDEGGKFTHENAVELLQHALTSPELVSLEGCVHSLRHRFNLMGSDARRYAIAVLDAAEVKYVD